PRRARPRFGPGVPGLIARAVYALLEDSGSSASARVRGLRHMGLGFLVLLAWVGIITAVRYLVFWGIRLGHAPAAPGARPAPDHPPPGFVWILFLTVFPAAWSTLKILIGAFQAIAGVPFFDFHDWYENLPLWAILLLTPLLVIVVVPLVMGLLVGTLALC